MPHLDLHNPLLWAILIGWIMSVVLHEFAHGLAAHLGGDYTIRERGGLTLNPLQYVDPLMSIILPIVFLMMGGIPLPGGSTYIRRDLLRSAFWHTAVSLAGPAMNLLIFLILALLLRPAFGWVDYAVPTDHWTVAQQFVAAMAYLQLYSVILNLVPVPPLDGFQAVAHFLPPRVQGKLRTPPWNRALFYGFMLMLWQVPQVSMAIYRGMNHIMHWVGVDFIYTIRAFFQIYRVP